MKKKATRPRLTLRHQYLNDAHHTNVQLTLMNSFNTHDVTQKILQKYRNTHVETFNQSRYPRIFKENLMPLPKGFDSPIDDWSVNW